MYVHIFTFTKYAFINHMSGTVHILGTEDTFSDPKRQSVFPFSAYTERLLLSHERHQDSWPPEDASDKS